MCVLTTKKRDCLDQQNAEPERLEIRHLVKAARHKLPSRPTGSSEALPRCSSLYLVFHVCSLGRNRTDGAQGAGCRVADCCRLGNPGEHRVVSSSLKIW